MIGKLLTKVFGSSNDRILKQIRPIVSQINDLESQIQSLDDGQLAAKTVSFKERLGKYRIVSRIIDHHQASIKGKT